MLISASLRAGAGAELAGAPSVAPARVQNARDLLRDAFAQAGEAARGDPRLDVQRDALARALDMAQAQSALAAIRHQAYFDHGLSAYDNEAALDAVLELVGARAAVDALSGERAPDEGQFEDYEATLSEADEKLRGQLRRRRARKARARGTVPRPPRPPLAPAPQLFIGARPDFARVKPVCNGDQSVRAMCEKPYGRSGFWTSTRTAAGAGAWSEHPVAARHSAGAQASIIDVEPTARVLELRDRDDVAFLRRHYSTPGGALDFEALADDYDGLQAATLQAASMLPGWDVESTVWFHTGALRLRPVPERPDFTAPDEAWPDEDWPDEDR